MTLDREAAASSLSAIEQAERRTGQAILYGVASAFLILWGVLTTAGYLMGLLWPRHAPDIWAVLMAAGFGLTIVMTRRYRQGLTKSQKALGWRLVCAQFALMGYGLSVVTALGPFTGRQLDAFWPLLFMLGYVLAGIWVGLFFVLSGITIAALTIIGYFFSDQWFPLWMAVVNGGGLLLGGLWLRRQGASL